MKHLWPYHKDAMALALGAFSSTLEFFTLSMLSGLHRLYLKHFHSVQNLGHHQRHTRGLCGIGLILRPTRAIAGKASCLLIVLYWANLNMWINDIPLNGNTFPLWAHILRALAQLGMIAVAAYLGEWIREIKLNQD